MDFEVLLVDDGSTDNSAEICHQFTKTDNRFSYFYKENGGVSSARNYGIERAQGEWICFIDADDWVNTDYLQILSSQHPQADVTFFGANLIYINGKQEKSAHVPIFANKREDIEETIFTLKCGPLGNRFGWTWNKMFRTKIIQKYNVRFSEEISFREDEIFTWEYCRYITSIRIINETPYNYRVTTDGLTKRGLQVSNLIPLSTKLEENLKYYSNPRLKEHILKSATDYRAKNIYDSPFRQLKANLDEYRNFVRLNPQPGKYCEINHMTQYINKSYWLGYFYYLIRKI